MLRKNGMIIDKEADKDREFWQPQIDKYIADPNTRVFIDPNSDAGPFWYSVVVDNSGGFWLDSFDTEEEAMQFIKNHNLKMVD